MTYLYDSIAPTTHPCHDRPARGTLPRSLLHIAAKGLWSEFPDETSGVRARARSRRYAAAPDGTGSNAQGWRRS